MAVARQRRVIDVGRVSWFMFLKQHNGRILEIEEVMIVMNKLFGMRDVVDN